MTTACKISIVVPCYNETESIREFYRVITEVLNSKYHYELIFVNDGSTDDTLSQLKELADRNANVKYISFSRNFGHQNALKAGLDLSEGDAVISLDADLQHPPRLIPTLIQKWEEGNDVVYTVREEHASIGFFKKITSRTFYKMMNGLSETKIEIGASDFRLLDRKVVDVLKSMPESSLFLRGMISWMGFQQMAIPYQADERFAGQSKYTIRKMIKLASSGITSFSIRPLKLSIYIGVTLALMAFAFVIYALIIHFFTDQAIPGWASIVVGIMFFSGVNLLFLGIIGEYLGKLFLEHKGRPNYIIRETNIDSK
ncbi:MAG: glycosyltransferase [Prolixibacteraceae bacterium]